MRYEDIRLDHRIILEDYMKYKAGKNPF